MYIFAFVMAENEYKQSCVGKSYNLMIQKQICPGVPVIFGENHEYARCYGTIKEIIGPPTKKIAHVLWDINQNTTKIALREFESSPSGTSFHVFFYSWNKTFRENERNQFIRTYLL